MAEEGGCEQEHHPLQNRRRRRFYNLSAISKRNVRDAVTHEEVNSPAD